MFKIAYDAGHWYGEEGRRILKSIDPNETREWTLNDRVADYFKEAASQYKDVELLRVDDITGKTHVSLATRTTKANNWGADFYLSIHHDAGINGGKGGGITSYCYMNGGQAEKYRDAIYDELIKQGGLKGNRAEPKTTANYHVLRESAMPAVLVEYGYMDSVVDAPIINTAKYAQLVAYATMAGIANKAGLKKKEEAKMSKTKFKDENKMSSWAVDAIKKVSEAGIMNGDPNGKFRPKDCVSREELAVVIAKMLK